MSKLRIGVLGAGLFACWAHIPQLLASGEAEVTAVCRRDPEALEQVARQFGVPHRYTAYQQMLAEEPLDSRCPPWARAAFHHSRGGRDDRARRRGSLSVRA